MASVEVFLAAIFWMVLKGVFGLWVLWSVIAFTLESMVASGAKLDAMIEADERRRRGGVVIDG